MKTRLRLIGSALALLLAAPAVFALTPTEWSQRQPFMVAAPGLVKLSLPASTFDAAQPGLGDLRIVDAHGQELPYLLDSPPRPAAPSREDRLVRPKAFRVRPSDAGTELMLETGTADRLDAVVLESSAPFFLKAAHVETSADGQEWRSLGAAVPLFRQFGAEQLRLPLDRKAAAFVRVTLDDIHSIPVTFTGARILRSPQQPAPPPSVPVAAKIVRRDEFAGETVLTIELAGRQVPLARLGLEVKDPLFMRRITVAVREVRGSVAEERTVGGGTLYRVALEGAPVRAELDLPLEFLPPARELLIHIHNGDSPPLAIDGVLAAQTPVHALFMAPAAGSYAVITGNPQAVSPRYDLAAFANDLRAASAAALALNEGEPMPGYHPRETTLPEVPLTGAPLDTHDWAFSRALQVNHPGVQELELDPAALARSRPDFADLRLLRAGNQIPYLLEQPGLARSLALAPLAVPDAKRPSVSVWRLDLPYPGLPLRRLVLSSTTPLFQRQVRLYEKISGPDGATIELTTAAGAWSRTPEPGMPETRTFELTDRLRTRTLWIESDNGDNPAIALGAVQVVYPVTRLIFKVTEADGLALAYGHKTINAPQYDLSLVAVKLLTSSRNVATLAAPGAGEADDGAGLFGGLNRRYLLWGVLALVVVALLAIVAKLLPKAAK